MPFNPNHPLNQSSDDVSISQNSVFDWGHGGSAGGSARNVHGGRGNSAAIANAGSYNSYAAAVNSAGGLNDSASTNDNAGDGGTASCANHSEPITSRYDPKAMSRIVDITDLVDESSDNDDSDDDIVGGEYGNARNNSGGGTGGTFGGMNMPGSDAHGGRSVPSGGGGLFGHNSSRGAISTSVVRTKGGNGGGKGGRGRATTKLHYGPGLACRQVMVLTSLVAVIVAAIIGIGFSVMTGDIPVGLGAASGGNGASVSASASGGMSGGGMTQDDQRDVDQEEEEQDMDNEEPQVAGDVDINLPPDQQTLLMTAERVIIACSPLKLDEDISECQSLCHASMCCFEFEKGNPYNCEDDESKMCGVYAGCEALLEGVVEDGLDEEED